MIDRTVGAPLGWSTAEAAAAIFDLATERMVGAIEDVTANRGVDPAGAVLVGGGGSSGFNVVAIARRLGCGRIVIPSTGATLSAAGAPIGSHGRVSGAAADSEHAICRRRRRTDVGGSALAL